MKPIVLFIIGASLLAAEAVAQAEPADCVTVNDALKKLFSTPNHQVTTYTEVPDSGRDYKKETVTDGKKLYVMVHHEWRVSAFTEKGLEQDVDQTWGWGKFQACSLMREESVEGEDASVYGTRATMPNGERSQQIWISKGSGLPLKMEGEFTTAGSLGRTHAATRIDYKNVVIPKNAKKLH